MLKFFIDITYIFERCIFFPQKRRKRAKIQHVGRPKGPEEKEGE